MSLGTITSQTYLSKDFDDLSLTSGGWTTQVVVDTTNWKVSEFNGDKFAKVSNHNGTNNVAAETWLISPSIDISSATSPVVSFETIMKYTGPAIQLMVSTDYNGTSAPSTATWTDITAGATLDVNDQTWGNWTPSGEVALSSYIGNSVYIAFKYTGGSTNGSTWEVDNIQVAEAGTPTGGNSVPVAKTIEEIQSDVDSNGDSNFRNDSVITSGIVTAVNIYQGSQKGYYIQDGVGPWKGIYVKDTVNSINRGDSITITAIVDEYYNCTELKGVTSFSLVSQYNDVAPTTVSTANVGAEQYESVLIKVINATCNTLPSGATFGDWIINDGSGDINVDKRLYQYQPNLNQSYNVTGIVGYAFSTWQIYPRDANDIQLYVSINKNNNILTSVYPNPSINGVITVEVSKDVDLIILDLLGNVVMSKRLNNNINKIDVSNLASGNYIVKVGLETNMIMVK